ncbi:MAG: hypothetical protein AB1750_09560, partial [Chloroflexota bacterium]
MEVETPSGVATVRGSYMMAYVAANLDVTITCLEGNCSASNPAGTENFTDGQKVTLFHFDPSTGKYRSPFLEDMNEEDFQQWLDENPEAHEVYQQVLAQRAADAPTATPKPTATPVPPTATPVSVPSESSAACVQLVSPTDGAEFPNNGVAEFSWTPYPGAAKYRLTIVYPTGATAVIETTETSSTRYMDAFAGGGEFSWSVSVLDDQGGVICQSASLTFKKQPPDVKEPNSNDEPAQPPSNGNGNQNGN